MVTLDDLEVRPQAQELDSARLRRLRDDSILRDVVWVEVIWHDQIVRFDITGMELKFLDMQDLHARYLGRALEEVGAVPKG